MRNAQTWFSSRKVWWLQGQTLGGLFMQTQGFLSGAPSPSCGARRMVETSAHLIDHVIPTVPVRQWVLSFPWPLRLLFARRPNTLSRCLAVIIRAIETDLIRRAGLTRAGGGNQLPYDIELQWVPTPVAVLLCYMTHHLSEQTDLLKP